MDVDISVTWRLLVGQNDIDNSLKLLSRKISDVRPPGKREPKKKKDVANCRSLSN